MNFPDKMYFLSAHFRQLAGEDVSNKPINWCIAVERKFVQAEEPTSYWELTLTDGSLCWQVMKTGLSSEVEPYLRIKGNALKECLTAAALSGDQFFEIDMSWLAEIAGFLSRFENNGEKLTILQFGNGNGQVLFLSAKFNDKTTYEHRVRLLQDGEPIFERLWGKLIEKLAADTNSLTLESD